jgi:hypothetical protein
MGAGGKMKRASVPTVVNKMGHKGFCGYESVPKGVACKRTESHDAHDGTS